MTVQFPDRIFFEGELHAFHETPLDAYVEAGGKLPDFPLWCSACHRGYVATWAIISDRLFLIDMMSGSFIGKRFTFNDVFPDAQGPIFAEWYTSDCAYIPMGELVLDLGVGFGGVYERAIQFSFVNGVMTSCELKHSNIPPRPPPLPSARERGIFLTEREQRGDDFDDD